MDRWKLAVFVLAGLIAPSTPASAGPVYLALGDSITFGETDLSYVQSYGDRGYVGLVANALAARNGGARPSVVNLAIDGETASSFLSGSGRVTPVVGRTDAVLAAENLNYNAAAPGSQQAKFLSTVAAQQAAGNTISTVSITLGFNDLSTLVGMPASAVGPTLAAYQASYGSILAEIHSMLPNAQLLVLGYYNPFPADPASPAAPIFNTYGKMLNTLIAGLATQNGGTFIDTAPPFIGHEADLTYLAAMPHGSSSPPTGPYVGTLPIGNVHPNAAGYAAIAGQVIPVPEPASIALLGAGLLAAGAFAGRRRP